MRTVLGRFLLVSAICIAYFGCRFFGKKEKTASWGGAFYVERFGGDNFSSYINSEYLTVCPGGKRIMQVEIIRSWR